MPEETQPAPRYEGTIIAVGDSLTAGLGVDEDDAWPALLQGKLTGSGLNWEVVNGGISGETSAGALAKDLRQAWDATHSMVVVSDETERAWVAIASDGSLDLRRMRFRGKDDRARTWTTTLALEFLRRLLLGLAEGWAE